jgi:hypothetical protein
LYSTQLNNHNIGRVPVAVRRTIDASAFNPTFSADFPRFVQHAIWRYCAHVLRRHEPSIVPKHPQLATEMMRADASLHAD